MDIDPTHNTIVFEFRAFEGGDLDRHLARAPTKPDGAVERAWEELSEATGLTAERVTRLYSEWEPGPLDAAFISQAFSEAGVSYSFKRPTDGDWERAFADAAAAIRSALERDANDTGTALLLPVLRELAATDDELSDLLHEPTGEAGELAVTLARVGLSPAGAMNVEYVLRQQVSGPDEAELLFEQAWRDLARGLRVDALDTNDGRFFGLTHGLGMASSAIALPGFFAQASAWIEFDEVFCAFPNPDELYVAVPGTPVARQLRDAVLRSTYWGDVRLVPACYVLREGGLERVAERQT